MPPEYCPRCGAWGTLELTAYYFARRTLTAWHCVECSYEGDGVDYQ